MLKNQGLTGDATKQPITQPKPVVKINKGFDTTENCAPHADAIVAAGFSFVCRYSSHSAWKNMTRAEVVALSKAGLYVVNVWETAGDHAAFFNHAQGVKDGVAAYDFAQAIGQPFSAPIYFAVDFDASVSQLTGGVLAYFQGVRDVMLKRGALGKSSYRMGAYGSGAVCDHLKAYRLVTFTWLAYAPGWSGNKTYTDWNIRQTHNGVRFAGMDTDLDETKGNGGGFTVA